MSTTTLDTPVARYHDQGYCSPLRIMSAAEAASYRARLEESERKRGRPLDRFESLKPYLLFDWAAELIRHPAVLDAVEPLLGPDILVWEASVITKEASGRQHLTWHQDLLYWGLEPAEKVVTAWIALSPSTRESGCMRVVPGSHRTALAPHVDTHSPDNLLGRGQEIQVEVDEADAADIILAPGEMSLHDVMIIHGSERNHSTDRRIGFAVRYMSADVRQKTPVRDCATLVRGTNRFNNFDLEPVPTTFDTEEARAIHAAVRRQRGAVKEKIM